MNFSTPKKIRNRSQSLADGCSTHRSQPREKRDRSRTPGIFSRSTRRTPIAKKQRITSPFTCLGTANKRKPRTPYGADRFIPSSKVANKDLQEFKFSSYGDENDGGAVNKSSAAIRFQDTLAKELFNGDGLNAKVLKFKKVPKPSEHHHNRLRVLYSANREARRARKKNRYISAYPERILDAPDILDDYYINVLDWSSSNILAVGLGPIVYLWNASTQEISTLLDTQNDDNPITSIRWMNDGIHVAIGTTEKTIQIWNVENQKLVRTMKGHNARVSALSWNRHLLSSGGRDSLIINHDVRVATHRISSFEHHTEEICGLEWCPEGDQLASGGNDNKCCIWELSSREPRVDIIDHKAAVKALAWSPHQRNLLATGAGTADRCIRFYNSSNGELFRSVPTNSQVCSLQWSTTNREIASAHGFSQNQITIWQYPTMTKMAELNGHSSRVLHTTLSPDGSVMCSAAADETLQFWKVFEPAVKKKHSRSESKSAADKRNLTRSIR